MERKRLKAANFFLGMGPNSSLLHWLPWNHGSKLNNPSASNICSPSWEHLAFTLGPLQASAPAGLTFHASCTQENAVPAALRVQFSLMRPNKEKSQQTWHARPQPGPLGLTYSDSVHVSVFWNQTGPAWATSNLGVKRGLASNAEGKDKPSIPSSEHKI